MFSKIHIIKHIAVIMSLVMFVSTVGIAVDFHFCQGDLQNISFFKKSKTCHEIVKQSHCKKHTKPPCHQSENDSFNKKKGCCDSESVVIQFDTEFSVPSIIDFNFNKSFLAVNSGTTLFEEPLGEFYQAKDYKTYKPPSRDFDHIILFQSFLI